MNAISEIRRLNRRTLLTRTWLVFLAGLFGLRFRASGATGSGPEFLSETQVAREWRGKVIGTRAAEYQKYLFDQGIVKLSQIDGNLGVQMFRSEDGETTEFVVISYWPNLEAIRKYAGNEIEKPHHLPRDPEFLITLPEKVQHYQILVDSRA
jgi:heme-degrading monooxygenase HmoA